MTKDEHIQYWLTNAEKDWHRAELCFKDKDYVFCLFCLHLAIEKICKSAWVKCNKGNYPPHIHNLEKLLKQTNIELNDDDWILLVNLNRFNLEGRYPDYKGKIYKECNRRFTQIFFKQVKTLKSCLLKKLQ
ncbi:MAG: HEPN domain-containing protein [Bacteroidia bacterium]|nr:HEPN domain-containing protein [Bacteroidia bacterium]